MTTPHRATPEQWAEQKMWVRHAADSSCILELRDRLEALEALYETMRQATLDWGKDVDNHGRWIDDHLKRIMALEAGQQPNYPEIPDSSPAPADSLVERVATAIDPIDGAPLYLDEARAAIRGVAAWLRSEYPRREGYGTDWANLIEEEANP